MSPHQGNTANPSAGYDANRYAPTSVAVLLLLPESSARAFAVASALGRFLDQQGTSERVRSGKEASGTRIDQHRLTIVLEALAIQERQWRRYVADWERRFTAHRCGQRRVFLFARALPQTCAGCDADVIYDHVPSSPRPKHGAGFAANGRTTTGPTVVLRPKSGAVTTATAAQERPLTRTDVPHHETGINGMEVGVDRDEALERFEALERVKALLGATELHSMPAPDIETTLTDVVVGSFIASLIGVQYARIR